MAPLSTCEILFTHNKLSYTWIYNVMKRSVVSIGIRKTPWRSTKDHLDVQTYISYGRYIFVVKLPAKSFFSI